MSSRRFLASWRHNRGMRHTDCRTGGASPVSILCWTSAVHPRLSSPLANSMWYSRSRANSWAFSSSLRNCSAPSTISHSRRRCSSVSSLSRSGCDDTVETVQLSGILSSSFLWLQIPQHLLGSASGQECCCPRVPPMLWPP